MVTRGSSRGAARSYEFRAYVIFSSLLLLSILAVKQDVLVQLESRLAAHMIVEHAIFFLIGALSVLSAETIMKLLTLRSTNRPGRSSGPARLQPLDVWRSMLRLFYGRIPGIVWIAVAVVLMAFWHLQYFFVLAVLHPEIHALQHLSFIAVGSAGFIATRNIGDSFRIALLLLVIGMMGFAGLLFSVLDKPVYPVYTVSDHNDAGGYMVLVSTVLLVVGLPLYLVRRSMAYVRAVHGKRIEGS